MGSCIHDGYHVSMESEKKNALVVLGPTASGKTSLGVALALAHGGEVVSADSRQLYRGLNIGSGKDLHEYTVDGKSVPYHLIDIVNLDHEFSVFEYRKRFFEVFTALQQRSALPVVVGGTGLYLEAVLKGYEMVEVPEDPRLRTELAAEKQDDLVARLRDLKPDMHNTTDLENRERLTRAIEIETYSKNHSPAPTPKVDALILGTRWDRRELHERIEKRLRERIDAGMIDEVEGLIAGGVAPERLRLLGLEYRFITDHLDGKIRNKNDLIQKLNSAIRNFAKRQETWFRRMERNGVPIHWIGRADIDEALKLSTACFARIAST